MNSVEVRIQDKDENKGKSEEQVRKDLKKIDRFIKKADAKIRSYEKQIEQFNGISNDTKKQVELGLSLLLKDENEDKK